MHSVARWALAFASCGLLALPARAEPPAAAPAASPTVAPERAYVTAANLAEERAFEADARRYQKLAELTARLVREREQREFEAAAERYLRLAGLTQRLAEKASRELEESFQAEVDLYLKKRELTRELAERSAANSEAALATAPRW